MKNIFIVGSKGIPGAYGGYETFVDKLTEYHQNEPELKYHVACKNAEAQEFEYHNARCFNVWVPNIGPAQAVYYDLAALNQCCNYIKKNSIKEPIVYILTCRIGPFAAYFQKRIHKLGGQVYVNPDGHEWMRSKWNVLVRRYWKYSEKIMVKHADILICDSMNIAKYIHTEYAQYNPKTVFIAYGAEIRNSDLCDDDSKLMSWYSEKGIVEKNYYLIVARFVPENNFLIMIREFMKSATRKDLLIVTNMNPKFQAELKKKLGYESDPRIKFVGTVYDQELLMKIRENAFAYLHGHEVGGTNPSLLEALSSTELNLLLNVEFNREVAEEGALFWEKKPGSLASIIDFVETMPQEEIHALGAIAKNRIVNHYRWRFIRDEYKICFLEAAKKTRQSTY